MLAFAEPLNDAEPVTSPVNSIVRDVARVVAVPALPLTLPVMLPVKLPTTLAVTVWNPTFAVVATSCPIENVGCAPSPPLFEIVTPVLGMTFAT